MECPHCAASADRAPGHGISRQEAEEKQQHEEDSWAKLLKSSTERFRSPTNEDTQHRESAESQGEQGKKKGFSLPSQVTLSNSQGRLETDGGKSQTEAFGRSAEIQEAPLHDSWSSGDSGLGPATQKDSPDNLASTQTRPLQNSWSFRQSSQEPGPQKSSWARVLQAASSEPADEEESAAVEEIPETESADLGENVENFPRTNEEPEEKKGLGIFFRLLTVSFVLLALGSVLAASHHYFTNEAVVPSAIGSPGSDVPPTPTDDATIWLVSAQESLSSKDFRLAVAQLERALSYLGEGEQKRLKETQVLLAETYSKAGDYSASATLWTELAKSYPDLKKKGKAAAAASLRANRLIANKQVSLAEQAVASKEFDKAIQIANEALRIYQLSQGQNNQQARAHGVLGDAYLGQQNTRVAFFHFTKAHKLEPQGRYRAELGKLKLPVRPKARVKPVKRVKPKFVIETDVPQANGRR